MFKLVAWPVLILALTASPAPAQAGAETFVANATIKTAGGASPNTTVTITVTHIMSQAEIDKYLAAFKSGGAAALHKALTGVPSTGSIQIGAGKPTPTVLTLERPSDRGRLLTIVSNQPLIFLGAGTRPKEGFDFGIVDLVVAKAGAGSGTMLPAAKVTVKQDVFSVDEYSGEAVQLTGLKKVTK